jgi:hypothetical protein
MFLLTARILGFLSSSLPSGTSSPGAFPFFVSASSCFLIGAIEISFCAVTVSSVLDAICMLSCTAPLCRSHCVFLLLRLSCRAQEAAAKARKVSSRTDANPYMSACLQLCNCSVVEERGRPASTSFDIPGCENGS